ncbi:MAG: hypothetical protein IJ228_06670 [Succinivibrio sp.]|nr:hypothetical protein [Succinivibrio sp.]
MFNPVRAVQLCVYLIRYIAPLSEWQLNTLLYLCQRDYLLHDLRHLLDDPLEMTPRGPRLKHCAREIAALFALTSGKPNLFNRALEINDEGFIAVNASLNEADPLLGTGAWRPVELQAVNTTVTERLHFLTLSALRRVISRGLLPECAGPAAPLRAITLQTLFELCGKSTDDLQQAEELLEEQRALDAELSPAPLRAGFKITVNTAHAGAGFKITITNQHQGYVQQPPFYYAPSAFRSKGSNEVISANGKVITPHAALNFLPAKNLIMESPLQQITKRSAAATPLTSAENSIARTVMPELIWK